MAGSSDREYKITIEFADAPREHSVGGENPVPTPNESAPQQDSDPGNAAAKAAKDNQNAAAVMVQQMAKKVATNALNNYGNFTGDYVTQQNMQVLVSEAAQLGSSISMGWAGIALYAVDKVIDVYNYYGDRARSERDAKFKRERVYASVERS